MKSLVEDELVLRSYLLGYLSPEEQVRIEERLFLETDYFRQLEDAEDALIDDYLTGDLSPDDKQRFHNFFLSKPERYETLRIAIALRKYISKNVVTASPASDNETRTTARSKSLFLPFLHLNRPVLRFSLVAALLLITLGGLWVVVKVLRKPSASAPSQAQRQSQQEGKTKEGPPVNAQPDGAVNSNTNTQREQYQYAEQQPPKNGNDVVANVQKQKNPKRPGKDSTQEPSALYSVLLLPGGPVRDGGEVNTLTIPPKADFVNLRLALIGDTNYRSYQARLKTVNDSTLLTRIGLEATVMPSEKSVSFSVPTQLLSQQKYRIELLGVTANGKLREINVYSFQVKR